MSNSLFHWSLAAMVLLLAVTSASFGAYASQNTATSLPVGCRVEPIEYMGWQAQQVSNAWIKLIFVPQNGGRLMQVVFDDHAFFFVNRKYAGKHLPPSNTEWFNYGGEKMWAYPDRHREEEQQRGNLDMLDYSEFGGE